MRRLTSSTIRLRLAVAAGLPFTAVFSLTSGAQPCTTQKSFDGSLLHYSLCTVPDIDQRRVASEPFTPGLPNGGAMYCAPTSAMNWMAYIANHGYPGILPGPGNWGPETGMVQPQYQAMNVFLHQMGDLMDTDPVTGTDAGGAKFGMQVWLDSLLPIGDFVVSSYQADGVYSPYFINLAKAGVDGALVSAQVGWYVPWNEAPQEIQDVYLTIYGKLPKGLYRDGGHVASMASARNDFQFQQIGLRDPANPNDGATFDQSKFSTDVYHVVDEIHTFGGETRAQSRVEGLAENAFIDGYFSIKPKHGLTADRTLLQLIRPIHLQLENGTASPPAVTSFQSATGGNVLDVAIHPERTTHPYLIEGDNTIWQIEALTGESTRFATVGNPKRLTFGGREQSLYVLLPNHVIALGTDARQKARVLLPEPLADIAYDGVRNRVVGLAASGDKVLLFDDVLRPIDTVRFEVPFCRGDASAATEPRTGIIWLLCHGSSRLTRLRVGDGRFGETGFDVSEVVLDGAEAPSALTLDDAGNLLVSDRGSLTVYAANGRKVEGSRFTGLPGGSSVDVLRSFSNFDPRTMTDIRYRNVLPSDARH